MKIAKNTMQQGDHVGRKIESLPPGDQKIIGKDTLILEISHTTNHKHQISSKGSELVEISGKRFLNLKSAATLIHEEHKPIKLSAGIWELGKVQEFDYFLMMKRSVAD